ncbi:MAG: hypothetical protein EON58_23310 [Alphaproteobacteria bacterium]|nr:MAG: hypothetical protein EON58_23310 [Alphaproteobacteria bacterium]
MALPSYEEERAVEARRFVGSADPKLDAYARMALASSGTAGERASAIQGLISLPVEAQEAAYDAIGRTGESNEPLATELLQSLKYGSDQSYYGRVQAITRITPVPSPVWKALAATVESEGVKASASAANFLRDLPKPPTAMAFWALQNLQKDDGYGAYYSSVLAKMEMPARMVSGLAEQMADPETKPEYVERLRYIIRHQKNAQFTPEQQRALDAGPTKHALCEQSGTAVACSEVKRRN